MCIRLSEFTHCKSITNANDKHNLNGSVALLFLTFYCHDAEKLNCISPCSGLCLRHNFLELFCFYSSHSPHNTRKMSLKTLKLNFINNSNLKALCWMETLVHVQCVTYTKTHRRTFSPPGTLKILHKNITQQTSLYSSAISKRHAWRWFVAPLASSLFFWLCNRVMDQTRPVTVITLSGVSGLHPGLGCGVLTPNNSISSRVSNGISELSLI